MSSETNSETQTVSCNDLSDQRDRKRHKPRVEIPLNPAHRPGRVDGHYLPPGAAEIGIIHRASPGTPEQIGVVEIYQSAARKRSDAPA